MQLEQHFDHGSAGSMAPPVRRLDAGNASAAYVYNFISLYCEIKLACATNSAVVGDPGGSAEEGTETPDDRHRPRRGHRDRCL